MLIKRAQRHVRRGTMGAALPAQARGDLDRRSFLRRSGLVAGSLAAVGTLSVGAVRKAQAGPPPPPGAAVTVRISDVSPWRLEYARSFGAEAVDARDPDVLASLAEADVAFDATGKQPARQAALSALGRRGVLVCAGHGEALLLSVSEDLIAPERAVLGSEYFAIDELSRNLALLRDNRDLISRVITHTFNVRDIAGAFAVFLSGESGKVVVTQGDGR